ncbi:MAG: hypothetical protein R3C01_16175 [Planctomycetaceae bacterium]
MLGVLCCLFAVVTQPVAAQPAPAHPVANSSVTEDALKSRHIYVPVSELDLLADKDRPGVLLGREEFEQLLTTARQDGVIIREPKVDVLLKEMHYTGIIVDDELRLTLNVEAVTFGDGWHVVPLGISGLRVEGATQEKGVARLLRSTTPDTLDWQIQGAGAHQLTLELITPLIAQGSDRAASFGLSGAPTGLLELTLPPGKFVRVNGRSLPITQAPVPPAEADAVAPEGAGARTADMPIGGGKSLTLLFTDRDSESQTDTLTLAQTAMGLYAAPGEVTWTARTNLHVAGRQLTQMVASVPNSVEITNVESSGLESWELADDPREAGRTAITLNYRQPFDGARRITFQAVLVATPDDDWTVPTLRLNDVNSHVGSVTIQHPHGVRLLLLEEAGATIQPTGAESTPVNPMPPSTEKLSGEGSWFRFWEEQFSLRFRTVTKKSEVHAAITNLLDVHDAAIDLYTSVDVSTLFVPLFEVALRTPGDYEVVSLTVNDVATPWKVASIDPNRNEVRIPLLNPLLPGESRALRLHLRKLPDVWPVEDSPIEFALPGVQLVGADLVEALYGVVADAEVLLAPQSFTGLEPAKREELDILRRQVAQSGRELKLGYSNQGSDIAGGVIATRRATSIAAATITFLRADREWIETHLEAQLRITGGGTRELVFTLPDSVGTDLRFELLQGPIDTSSPVTQAQQIARLELPLIVEQLHEPGDDGESRWTLKLDRRAQGDLTIVTRSRQARGAVPEFPVVALSVVGAERQNGHLAVEASTEQRLELKANDDAGQPLPTVDVVDFPKSQYQPQGRIVASARYLRPGFRASVQEERFEREAIPTAFVHQASMKTLLDESRELHHQLELQLVAVGVQSLRLELGAGEVLLSALVDEVPVEVRTAKSLQATSSDAKSPGSIVLIPLTATAQPTRLRSVRLLYESESPPGGSAGTDSGFGTQVSFAGRFTQRPPVLAVVTGEGTIQPLEVLEWNWQVYSPPEVRLLDVTGAFHPQESLTNDSVLSRISSYWRLPTSDQLVTLGVAFGGIVLFCLILIVVVDRYRIAKAKWNQQGNGRITRVSLLWGCAFVIALFIGFSLLLMNLQSPMGSREAAHRTTSEPMSVRSEGLELRGGMDEYFNMETASEPGAAIEATPSVFAGGDFDDQGGSERAKRSMLPVESATKDSFQRPIAKSERLDNESPGRVSGNEQPDRRPAARGGLPPTATEPTTPFPTVNAPESKPADDRFSDPFAPVTATTPQAETRAAPDDLFNRQLAEGKEGQSSKGDLADAPMWNPLSEGEVRRSIQPATGKGALLSLNANLTPPNGYVHRAFYYRGASLKNESLTLGLDYGSYRSGQMITFAIAAGLLLLFWWQRNRECWTRLMFALVMLLGPWMLASFVGLRYMAILDGLFLGALAGCALWIVLAVRTCCVHLCRNCCGVSKSTSTLLILAGLSLLGHSSVSFAQESGQQGVRPFPQSTPSQAAQPPANQSQQALPNLTEPQSRMPIAPPLGVSHLPRTQDILIPYTPGQSPLSAEHVFVPQETFLKLWRKAHPETQRPARPPVEALLASALYVAELDLKNPESPTIQVTARFVVENLTDRKVRLPLPFEKVAIESATVQEQPGIITIDESSGRLSMLLQESGEQVWDVTFRLPAPQSSEAAGRFVLPLLSTPAARLSFLLPGVAAPGDKLPQLQVQGAAETYRIRRDGERPLVEMVVDRGGELRVEWEQSKIVRDLGLDVQAESGIAVVISDEGVRTSTAFSLGVRQGAMTELTFLLPGDGPLERIEGPDIGGWALGDVEAGSRSLTLFFRRSISDRTSLVIDRIRPLTIGNEAISVTPLRVVPQGVTRETGQLALFETAVNLNETTDVNSLPPRGGVSRFDIIPVDPFGLRQMNVGTFSPTHAPHRPVDLPRLTYRYSTGDFTLPLSVQRRQPDAIVNAMHGVRVELRTLHVASRFRFDLRESPRGRVSFAVPTGYQPVDVLAGQLSDWHLTQQADGATLTLEFDQPRTGTVDVALEGKLLREQPTGDLTLAVPLPCDVTEVETQLAILFDESLQPNLQSSTGWRSLNASGKSHFVFRRQRGEAEPVSFSLQRVQPELSANLLTLVAYSDTSVDYGLNIQWTIQGAPAETFGVRTPGWLGDHIVFDGLGLQQVEKTELPDGDRLWTLHLHDPVRDEWLVSALVTLPPPMDHLVRTPDIQAVVPMTAAAVEPMPLSVQRRSLVLVNLATVGRLVPTDINAIQTITAQDLTLKLRSELIRRAMAVASTPLGTTLPEWRVDVAASNAGAAAIVLNTHLRTQLAHDGSWRSQSTCTVRNRGRQFIGLRLPPEARLLSVMVRGRPSRAITRDIDGKPACLIPLPQASLTDLSYDIVITYAGQLPQPLPTTIRLSADEITVPALQVVSPKESEEFGLSVLSTTWEVYLPDDLKAQLLTSGDKTNMVPSGRNALVGAKQQTTLNDLQEMLRLVQETREAARRSQARDSLHNLAITIDSLNEQSRQKGYVANQEEQELRAQAQATLQQSQQLLNQESLGEGGGTILIDTSNSLLGNDFGRNFIADNNSSIAQDNQPQDGKESERFGKKSATSDVLLDEFGSNAFGDTKLPGLSIPQPMSGEGKSESKPGVPSKESGRKRSDVREQLSRQSNTFQQEESWLSSSTAQPMAPMIVDGTPVNGPQGGSRLFDELPVNQQPIFRQGSFDDGVMQQGQVHGDDLFAEPSASAPSEWRATGGLSLPIEFATAGEPLVFTKVGGDPQLALSLRVARSNDLLQGVAILIVLLCAILWVVRLSRRPDSATVLRRQTPALLMVIGLVAASFINLRGLTMLGLTLFAVGAIWWTISYSINNHSQSTTSS